MTTPPPEAARCETCRWFDNAGDYAFCRRYPPTVVAPNSNPDSYNSAFPETSSLDFCGEHQPRPAAAP